VGSERVGEFDAHVAQSAESNDADFLTLGHAPVAHRRISSDAGAQQGRGSSEVEIRRDAEHEALCHNDAVGVAAVSDASGVLVGKVVGEGETHTN